MPGRSIPLVTGEFYHVFNRGIDRCPTFTSKKECQRAVVSLKYYLHVQPPIKLARFLRLEDNKRREVETLLKNGQKHVYISAFCLMPNHFHLLVRQNKNDGIAKFLSNFQNSYTRYFNTLHERDGSLFLDQFKAIRIESDEQMIHVSRYIHLNPYTGFVVKTLSDLKNYPWSSLSSYLNHAVTWIDTTFVTEYFSKPLEYEKFVYDQADYQRKLKEIKHLTFE